MVVVSLNIVAVIMIFVVPAFKEVFTSFGADLPAPTLFVMALSEYFVSYWWLIFGTLGGGVYFFLQAWKRNERFQKVMDRLLLRMPVFGALIDKSCVARWTRTLATMFAAGVPLVVDEDLIETDFGGWEGLTFREAAEQDRDLHSQWLSDTATSPPGGESFAVVRARVERGLRRIVADRPGGVVAVVSHVTPIKLAIRAGLGAGDELLFRLHLDLASVSDVRFYSDGPTSVHLVNDTSHLV